MKHTTTVTNVFAIAMAAALTIAIAPPARAADKWCSNASLKGTFAYTVTGFLVPPAAPAGPFASVGTQFFDGNGITTATATVSLNGTPLLVSITGTYTVDADCTGSFTLKISPVGLTTHAFFAIDDSGAGFQAIQTDPGVIVTGIARRQFPIGDWRQ